MRARRRHRRRGDGRDCHLGHRTTSDLSRQHKNRSGLVELRKADFTHVSPRMRRGVRSTPRGSRDHPADLPHSRLQRPQEPLAAFSLVRARRSRGQLGYLRLLWTHSGQGTPRGGREDATKFAPSCLQPSKVNPNVGYVLIGVVTAKMDTTCSSHASHEKTRACSSWEGPQPWNFHRE